MQKKEYRIPIALRPVSAAGRAEKVDKSIILTRGNEIHNYILTQMKNARDDAEKITSIDIDNYRDEMAYKGGFPVSLRGDRLFVKIPIPGLRTMDAWGNVRQAYDEVSKKKFIKGAKKKLEGWDFERSKDSPISAIPEARAKEISQWIIKEPREDDPDLPDLDPILEFGGGEIKTLF